MPCDLPARRSPAGWAMLLGIALLSAFYLYCFKAMRSPPQDEEFRRTFLTGEFTRYPTSPAFAGRNGLDYIPGSTLDFDKPLPRMRLHRYDWTWRPGPGAMLEELSGRIFLHIEASYRYTPRPYQLQLAFNCNMPDGQDGIFAVSVNEKPVGHFTCKGQPADFTFTAVLPQGMIPAQKYDEIRIVRTPEGWKDELWTKLGWRLRAFHLKSLTLKPLPMAGS